MSAVVETGVAISGPCQFNQIVNVAAVYGRKALPFSVVDDVAEALSGWSTGRAGVRASAALDAAVMSAYRRGQLERAGVAIAQFMADNYDPADDDKWHREFLVESACIAAASATAASDGDFSTLITPDDIVNLIGEHIAIDDPTLAIRLASYALRDFHVGWREPTPEEDAEVAEELAALDEWLEMQAVRAQRRRCDTVDFERIENVARDEGDSELAAVLARRRLGMARPAAALPSPVDLWRRHEAPPLPEDCLPPVIYDFAVEQGRMMGADPAGLALSALAVCASAIDDAIVVQMKPGDVSWQEAARLWVGLVGMPSTKKSPIMSAAMRPLRAIDRDMASRNSLAMAEWQRLPKKEKDGTAQPSQPRRIVEDATVEALQEVLKDCPHGVLSAQDELSGWFGAMDKYSPGKGAQADRAFWLRAFNGGPYSVHRVGRGASYVPNLSINVLGGIQPEPLRKLVGDSLDDGLIQRFIPVILRPASAGHEVGSADAAEAYRELVRRLVDMKPPRAGNLAPPQPLRFAPEAQATRRALELEHVALVEALETASPKMAAHLGKHDGLFGKLAVIWHCVENLACEELPVKISGETADRVARFMREWMRPSAVAFYAGQLGMSAGHESLMAVASLIVSDALAEVDARTIQRSTRALKHVQADEARRLCEKLEAFGWLEPTDSRQRSNSPRWCVSPLVHEMFAERGKLEKERRAIAREAFASAFGG